MAATLRSENDEGSTHAFQSVPAENHSMRAAIPAQPYLGLPLEFLI